MGAENSGGVSKRAATGRRVKCTLPLAKRGGVNTVSLAKLFQAPGLLKKRSIFKVLHVKKGRKNTTNVFSAVVADDSAVIRLVTFGLINCQKAKSVLQEGTFAAAVWKNATYDPQEPHYRAYELENWQIKLHDSTSL